MSYVLQWGRGLLTAEIMLHWTKRGVGMKLQWGRGLLTAEIFSGIIWPFASMEASMGPRSFDRGNGAATTTPEPCAGRFNGAAVF